MDLGEETSPSPNGFANRILHRRHIGLGRLFGEGTLAHHIGTQCGVPNIARVVDPLGNSIDRVHVLRVGLPVPVDARQHGGARDIFGALEIPEHQVGFGFPARCEGETAVPHDRGRDAVIARTGTQWVPKNLRIHMGVAVHEAWGDNMAFGIEGLLGRIAVDTTNAGDLAVLHTDVCPITGAPGAVNYPAESGETKCAV
jgi:hypothetical protein